MKRLTSEEVRVDESVDRYLGPLADLEGMKPKLLDLILNGPVLNGVSKDVLRQIIRQLYSALAAYEDTGLEPEEVDKLTKDWSDLCTVLGECGGIDVLQELAEANKEGRLFLLPLEPGRSMLCQEHLERPWVMKNVAPCVQYQSSVGIVFYMRYDVFRGLVEHGKITPLSPEGEKTLEAMK
jgi:hypothetical protein